MGCCISEPDFDEDEWDHHKSLKSPIMNGRDDDTMSGTSDSAGRNECLFPSWMDDSATDYCCGCGKKFTLLNRKHHCRRCRDLFCEQCTPGTAQILLLSIREDVRVCASCAVEVRPENRYISEIRPFLSAGGSFTTPGSCFSEKNVMIRLLRDGCTLAIEDEKNSRKKTQMLLQDIDSVLIAADNRLVISYSFRGSSYSKSLGSSSSATLKQWCDGLKFAVERSRMVPLRQVVEDRRRLKVEAAKKLAYEQQRAEELAAKREHRKEETAKIRSKWF